MEENLKIPNHVAIILDGNGRWAKAKGMPRNYGHVQGAKTVEVICGDSVSHGICFFHRELEPAAGRSGCADEIVAQLYENLSEDCRKKSYVRQSSGR